jgi:hypothetical protein
MNRKGRRRACPSADSSTVRGRTWRRVPRRDHRGSARSRCRAFPGEDHGDTRRSRARVPASFDSDPTCDFCARRRRPGARACGIPRIARPRVLPCEASRCARDRRHRRPPAPSRSARTRRRHGPGGSSRTALRAPGRAAPSRSSSVRRSPRDTRDSARPSHRFRAARGIRSSVSDLRGVRGGAREVRGKPAP